MTGLVITLLRTKDDAAALVAGIQELDGLKQLLVACINNSVSVEHSQCCSYISHIAKLKF